MYIMHACACQVIRWEVNKVASQHVMSIYTVSAEQMHPPSLWKKQGDYLKASSDTLEAFGDLRSDSEETASFTFE